MLFENYYKQWSKEWVDSMNSTDNYKKEIRSKEESTKQWDEISKTYDQTMGKDLKRVDDTIQILKDKNYLNETSKVLDIGSGTGIFSIPLAKFSKEVTCIDISQGMLDSIKNKAEQENLNNLRYIKDNWHEINLKESVLEKRFDIVISSINCRGICNAQMIEKMNQASKGVCCLLTWSGDTSNNHTKNLRKLILEGEISKSRGNDIIYPFNVVYSSGYSPTLDYTSIRWNDCSDNVEEIVKNICKDFWRFTDITNEITEKIRNYVN
ncbi:MAG: class I SAM-dependent methyltransferase, partial [Peptostreptococcaceae bacterium]